MQTADGTLNSTLSRIASGMTEEGRQQAALGIKVGGLGLRKLQDIAVAASLASKVRARPKVSEIGSALTRAGFMEEGQLVQNYDRHRDMLVATLQQQLHEQEAGH
eukprot:12000377-Karenia_brevis.AAC.1